MLENNNKSYDIKKTTSFGLIYSCRLRLLRKIKVTETTELFCAENPTKNLLLKIKVKLLIFVCYPFRHYFMLSILDGVILYIMHNNFCVFSFSDVINLLSPYIIFLVIIYYLYYFSHFIILSNVTCSC
jgi:hypothetical protein